MATLVLGTIGRALGGPLGGLAGTFFGALLDRGILGGGKTREGPRESNLTVQSAAYGEPIPRLYGRMRVAGNLVWTAGIRETRGLSGGGKRGAATASYTYSASFAVIVAARRIDRIERVWADGKLLRASNRDLIFPAVIRTYPGSEDQPVDPLIAAAEGIDAAPAYRGRAYVVFEDLPLADFGNRIPNLTFEVVADAGEGFGVAAIVRDVTGDTTGKGDGGLPAVQGFAATRAGSIRGVLDQLAVFAELRFDAAARLDLDATATAIDRDRLGASEAAAVSARHESRDAAAGVPDALVIGFSDPARDYQPGLQRAVRRSPPLRIEQHDLPAALDAPAAKALAEDLMRRAIAARTTGTLALPWAYAALRPGDIVNAGTSGPWRIRRWTMTGATIELDVARIAAVRSGGTAAADAGRVYVTGDAPAGPTTLHVLELPPLPGVLPTLPRLWLAAAGAGPGWRRAAIVMSSDGGGSYASVATIDGPSTIGTAATVLAQGITDCWDRRSSLDVILMDDGMSLDSCSEAAVLAGANLALVGGEIVQFATVVALGPARFRLSTFLRGRRGTESATTGHAAGERFILLDPDRLAAVDLPLEAVGASMIFKAVGAADDVAAVTGVGVRVDGTALRPLSPAALTIATLPDGGWSIGWLRRSRAGFAWADGADAPLGEEVERYRVTVMLDGVTVRETDVAESHWDYAPSLFNGDGGGSALRLDVAVAQVSATVGAGAAARSGVALA